MLQNQEKLVVLLLEYYENYKKICIENENTWQNMDKDIWESVLVEYGNYHKSEVKHLPSLSKTKQLKLYADFQRAKIIDFHQQVQSRKSEESIMGRDKEPSKSEINIQYSQNNK